MCYVLYNGRNKLSDLKKVANTATLTHKCALFKIRAITRHIGNISSYYNALHINKIYKFVTMVY
jgi:hypothetical protein